MRAVTGNNENTNDGLIFCFVKDRVAQKAKSAGVPPTRPTYIHTLAYIN